MEQVQSYKRKITYFYEYHNGTIGSTAGFLKLEIRGENVKITINIQEAKRVPGQRAALYFYHEAGDRLMAVKVDEVDWLDGALTYQNKTSWQELFDTGRDLYTFDGVVVAYSDNHYYLGDFGDRDRKNYELIWNSKENDGLRPITDMMGERQRNHVAEKETDIDRTIKISRDIEQKIKSDSTIINRENGMNTQGMMSDGNRADTRQTESVYGRVDADNQQAETRRMREDIHQEQGGRTGADTQRTEAGRVGEDTHQEQKDETREYIRQGQVRAGEDIRQAAGRTQQMETVSGRTGEDTRREQLERAGEDIRQTAGRTQQMEAVYDRNQADRQAAIERNLSQTTRTENGSTEGEHQNAMAAQRREDSGNLMQTTGMETGTLGAEGTALQNAGVGQSRMEPHRAGGGMRMMRGRRNPVNIGNGLFSNRQNNNQKRTDIVDENARNNTNKTKEINEQESQTSESCKGEKDIYERCENCPYQQAAQRKEEEKDAFSQMLAEYPKLPMYGATELFDCVRIHPKDIGRLDMRNWKLGVNSFLTHGFYTYQYLLLGRMRFGDGTQHQILGVPGVYSNREKYLADMFGFERFIPVKKTGIKTGEFGYWIVELSAC